jgi:hypothetical protein
VEEVTGGKRGCYDLRFTGAAIAVVLELAQTLPFGR